MFTGVVSLCEGDPSGDVDESGDGGDDRVSDAAAQQEEHELRVVLQGVLVGALKNKRDEKCNNCNLILRISRISRVC